MAVQLRLRRRDVPSGLDKVLLPGEKLVLAVHEHWATLLALALAIWVDSNVTKETEALGTICWWIFLAVLLRLLWVFLDWGNHWFIATDKRLLLRYGIIARQVGMMPLIKVTDLRYERSAAGRVLGYGKFVLESAGQDQALREVKWVIDPDNTYRKICAEIFHIPAPTGDDDFEEVVEELPVDDLGDRGGPTDPVSPIWPGGTPMAYPDVHRTHSQLQTRLDSYSRAVPVQRGPVTERPRHETIYESEDLRRLRRSAETGPIAPPVDDPADD